MKNHLTALLIAISAFAFGQQKGIDFLWELHESQEYEKVIEHVKPIIGSKTLDIELNLILGSAYTEKGDYETAIKYLKFTIRNAKKDWQKAWAYGYLGICYFLLEDFENAKHNLNTCYGLKAHKDICLLAYINLIHMGFSDFYQTWETQDEEHFRFHFQKKNARYKKNYIETYQKKFNTINQFFQTDLPKKIDFFVWHSRSEAETVLQREVALSKPAMCVIHSHYKQSPNDVITYILSHFAVDFIQKSYFINDGVIMYFEKKKKPYLKQIKRWLKNNSKKITIQEVWENWGEYSSELTQPLSGLFVEQLITTFGRDKFMEFFREQTYENARIVFGEELDVLIIKLENELTPNNLRKPKKLVSDTIPRN